MSFLRRSRLDNLAAFRNLNFLKSFKKSMKSRLFSLNPYRGDIPNMTELPIWKCNVKHAKRGARRCVPDHKIGGASTTRDHK